MEPTTTLSNDVMPTFTYESVRTLDFQGIIIEENKNIQNSSSSDPFQRKLREKVFLAEVAFVDKLEKEKQFRVSEVYLGADILSDDDINTLRKQRTELAHHKQISELSKQRQRKITEIYSSNDKLVHAGASIDTSNRIQQIFGQSLTFDVNRNDIWNKRNHTLQLFIALVSKWIIRNRMNKIKEKPVKFLLANRLTSKEAVKAYVEEDHRRFCQQQQYSQSQQSGFGNNPLESPSNKEESEDKMSMDDNYTIHNDIITSYQNRNENIDSIQTPKSMAELVLAAFPKGYPNPKMYTKSVNGTAPSSSSSSSSSSVTTTRSDIDEMIEREIQSHMDKHVTIKQSKLLSPQKHLSILQKGLSSSRHSLPVKQKHHRRQSNFGMILNNHNEDDIEEVELTLPPLGLFHSAVSSSSSAASSVVRLNANTESPSKQKDRDHSIQRDDQSQCRQSCDNHITIEELLMETDQSASTTTTNKSSSVISKSKRKESVQPHHSIHLHLQSHQRRQNQSSEYVDTSFTTPSWLLSDDDWSTSCCKSNELNYMIPSSEYRSYIPEPYRCEMDDDWILRPQHDTMIYDDITSLKTDLLETSCFLSTNLYLFDGKDQRSQDITTIPSYDILSSINTTLSYHNRSDEDRHVSGLTMYHNDHKRSLFSRDQDLIKSRHHNQTIEYLQTKQDPNDYLTESESDDDELYGTTRPTNDTVRSILYSFDIQSITSPTATTSNPIKSSNTPKVTASTKK